MFTTIIVVFIILVIMQVIFQSNAKEKKSEKISKLGYDTANEINVGKYIGGHPQINDELKTVSIFSKNNDLTIVRYYEDNRITTPTFIATIPISNIKNISIENKSTIEKRVTIGRMLLVGPFAFAWKKKDVNELAFLVIVWNDGRFEHETVFEFEGKGSMQTANTSRNSLIKTVNSTGTN
jgi:hypothetical protein